MDILQDILPTPYICIGVHKLFFFVPWEPVLCHRIFILAGMGIDQNDVRSIPITTTATRVIVGILTP